MTNVIIDYCDNNVEVKFPYNTEVIALVKELDIRSFDWDKKVWKIGLTEVDKLQEMLVRYKHNVSFSASYSTAFLTDKPDIIIWTLEHKKIKNEYPFLFNYQVEDIVTALQRKEYLIGHEMGTGKTVIALVYLKELLKKNSNLKGLIIVPVSLIQTWLKENEKFTNLDIQVVRGNKKKREEQWKANCHFFITNYETIRGIKEHTKWNVVIADECQRMKNRKTLIHNSMQRLDVENKLAMSGTPIENSINDIYSIISWLTPNILPRYQRYRELFFIEEMVYLFDGRQFKKIIGYKNLDYLKKMIQPVFMRRERKEVIKDLPERGNQSVYVDLTHDENWQYNSLIEEKEELLKKGETVFGFITQFRKLTSGLDAKIDECVNICKETSGQIIIFGEYIDGCLKKLEAKLKKENITNKLVYGKVPISERDRFVDQFQKNEFKVLILQTKVGGMGLNLQNASTVVFLHRPWTLATEEQAISRVYRYGQTNKVMVYYLLSNTDFENRVNDILTEKGSVTDAVITNVVTDLKKRKLATQ